MSSRVIRKALASDAAGIAELEKATFPLPWSEEALLYDIGENKLATVLVAELDGSFAGYADIWVVAGEGQLNNIAVCEYARGQHVGLGIMKELFAELEKAGASEMSLEVRESNEAAIGLYRKLGFEEVGRREGYYLDNGETALIMRKEL